MICYNLDHDRIERIITGYREREMEMPGFELEDVTREGQRLEWVFHRDVHERFEPREFFFTFEDVQIIRLVPRAGMYAIPGDTMKMRYTLNWWWEGPDGDTRLPEPVPGAALHWEMIAA